MKIKIVDETGAVLENPDLTLGWLKDETEAVEHPAQEGVPELSHYVTVARYPNGGEDVQKVIDREGIPAKDAWTEQVPVQRYIRYTAEELAARKKAEQAAQLPTTEERLAALEAAMLDLLAAQEE